MLEKDLAYYRERFMALHVDRAHGVAPHKPILLLSVIELFDRGHLTENRILLSPELVAAFLKYWTHLGSSVHHPDIALPFYHLTGESFWHLMARPGFEEALQAGVKPPTIRALQRLVQYAYVDGGLHVLLSDRETRDALATALISHWFIGESDGITRLFGVDRYAEMLSELRRTGGKVYRQDDQDVTDEGANLVRDSAFRTVVTQAYSYQCALCRLGAIDSLGRRVVDGAHIKPFSQFYDDRIENGLSLCKNHHWAFDRGWFSIDPDFSVVVSQHVREQSPNALPIVAFRGQQILLPEAGYFVPSPDALAWHQENTFLG